MASSSSGKHRPFYSSTHLDMASSSRVMMSLLHRALARSMAGRSPLSTRVDG